MTVTRICSGECEANPIEGSEDIDTGDLKPSAAVGLSDERADLLNMREADRLEVSADEGDRMADQAAGRSSRK